MGIKITAGVTLIIYIHGGKKETNTESHKQTSLHYSGLILDYTLCFVLQMNLTLIQWGNYRKLATQ